MAVLLLQQIEGNTEKPVATWSKRHPRMPKHKFQSLSMAFCALLCHFSDGTVPVPKEVCWGN